MRKNMHIGRSFPQVYPRVLSIYLYLSIYLSISKPFALPGARARAPFERRVPLGHASVPLLEYALMALLSTLVIIFKVLYFPGNFANGNQKDSQVFSRYVQNCKNDFHQSSKTRRRSVPGMNGPSDLAEPYFWFSMRWYSTRKLERSLRRPSADRLRWIHQFLYLMHSGDWLRARCK